MCYVSFGVFRQIASLQAFFIIRIKANLKVSDEKNLEMVVPEPWLAFFSGVSDSVICVSNDKHQTAYRLVSFVAYDGVKSFGLMMTYKMMDIQMNVNLSSDLLMLVKCTNMQY